MKAKITTSHETPYKTLFILPSEKEIENDPYYLMRLSTLSFEVTYIICKKNLYIVAWITSEENVVRVFKPDVPPPTSGGSPHKVNSNAEFRKIKAVIEKMPVFKALKPDIVEFHYPGSYTKLQGHAGKTRSEIFLGRNHLKEAIHTLCRDDALPEETAKSLIVSIQMLSEVMRLRAMKNFVKRYYESGGIPSEGLVKFQNNWSKMSEDLIKFAETGEYFEIIIGGESYGTVEVSHAILIANSRKDRV